MAIITNTIAARRCDPRAVAVGALLVGSCTVVQAEIKFDPWILADALYTDNLDLAPSGGRGETLLHAAPGFLFTSRAQRLRTSVDYRLDAYMFASDPGKNTTVHNLKANGAGIVLPDWFFIDAAAAAGQVIRDPSVQIPTSDVISNPNLADTRLWSVTPRLSHLFTGGNTAEVAYQYGQVHYSGLQGNLLPNPVNQTNLNNVDSRLLRARFEHAGSGPFNWSTQYTEQEADYVGAQRYRYGVAEANLEYRLRPTFFLIGGGGGESDVERDQSSGSIDRGFWRAGFRWAPAVNQTLTATTGRRFFGKTYDGRYNYTGRVLQVNSSYSEQTTTAALATLGEQLQGPTGTAPLAAPTLIATSPLPPGSTVGPYIPGTTPSLTPVTADVYLERIARLSVELVGRRNQLTLSTFRDRRTYLDNSGTEQELHADLQWTYRLGPRTTADAGASFERYSFRQTPRVDRFTQFTAGINRRVGRHLSTDFRYRHSQRSVNNTTDTALEGFSYKENAVSVGMRYDLH